MKSVSAYIFILLKQKTELKNLKQNFFTIILNYEFNLAK